MWVYGSDKAWEEMNAGGDFKIPRIFFYIMKYVTPIVLFVIMIWWFVNDAIPILLLSNAQPENIPYIWGSRILMIIISVLILLLVRKAWANHSKDEMKVN
jgi:hypothetical protein